MAERKFPDDRELLNQMTSMWLPKKPREDDVTEDLYELAKKQSKPYEKIISELKYKWLCKEIEREIENAIITKELLSSTGKWEDREKQDKRLCCLYDELAEAARTYAPKE